jgi:hypothetical protein
MSARKLGASDLWSLERYARERNEFRARIIAHKKNRQLGVGPNTMWLFEDRLTVQYQVQEMLRTERIFEAEGIAEELEAYNPLIPDGTNLKATMMLEYPDVEERRAALVRLKGIEDSVYLEVGTLGRVFAHADEDLTRSDETKTSAVHFLRFELAPAMRDALKAGAALTLGIDHEGYRHELHGSPALGKSLAADFD